MTHDFPHVPPTQDGLRAALVEARRRRTRTAGVTGTAVSCALAAAWLSLSGGVTDSLVTRDEQVPSSTVTSTPSPGAVLALGPSPVPSVHASSEAGTTPALRPGATAAAPVAGTKASPRLEPNAPSTSTVMKRSDGTLTVPSNCTLLGGSGSYCSTSSGHQTSPTSIDMTAQLCSTHAGSNVLSFRTAHEVEMTVLKGTHELWHWSRSHPDSQDPHTMVLTAGTCSEWTTTWSGEDDAGARLAPGTYTFVVTFKAIELDHYEPVRTDLTLT